MSKFLICSGVICLFFTVACGGGQIRAIPSDKYKNSLISAEEAFKELDRETNGEKTTAGGENQSFLNKKEISEPDPEYIIEEKTSPFKTAEKKRPVNAETKYPMVRGTPVWLMEPEAEGYEYAAVGSAPFQNEGAAAQKRIAKAQALAEIARMVSVSVDNELSTEKTAVNRENGDSVSSRFSSYSRQRAEEKLANAEEIDFWTDPNSGILYVFLGIKYR